MPHRCLVSAGLALTLFGASCSSLTQVAPPVTAAMIAAPGSVSSSELERGRRVFAGPCASCHSADPVAKHTIPRWREIVSDMAPRAKLNATDKAALLAYLSAARAMPPSP